MREYYFASWESRPEKWDFTSGDILAEASIAARLFLLTTNSTLPGICLISGAPLGRLTTAGAYNEQ